MGLQSTHGRSLSTLYTKAALWWLFVFIRHCMTCVWNDICDRDIDRLVGESPVRCSWRTSLRPHSLERTKTRPLASGDMSMRGACLLLSILTLLTLTMLRIASGSRNLYVVNRSNVNVAQSDEYHVGPWHRRVDSGSAALGWQPLICLIL